MNSKRVSKASYDNVIRHMLQNLTSLAKAQTKVQDRATS